MPLKKKYKFRSRRRKPWRLVYQGQGERDAGVECSGQVPATSPQARLAATARLIELVKERPPLYVSQGQSDRDKPIVQELWAQIASTLKVTVAEAKYRWGALRSEYARDVRRARAGERTATGLPASEWHLAGHMHFLNQYIRPRARVCREHAAAPPRDARRQRRTITPAIAAVPIERLLDGAAQRRRGPAAAKPSSQVGPVPPSPDPLSIQQVVKYSVEPYFVFFESVYPEYGSLSPASRALFRRGCAHLLHSLRRDAADAQ